MISAVLDASALIAFLRAEPGQERVAGVLTEAVVSTVNLSEVVAHYSRNGGTPEQIRAMLTPLQLALVTFDEELAQAAGLLVPVTKSAGLSLGDRACLAVAQRLAVPVLTADRAWQGVARAVGVDVQLIR
jgi:ribonuclease VapC